MRKPVTAAFLLGGHLLLGQAFMPTVALASTPDHAPHHDSHYRCMYHCAERGWDGYHDRSRDGWGWHRCDSRWWHQ